MTIRIFTKLEDDVHEAASRKVGLDDFGDSGYRDGLRVTLKWYADQHLTESGYQLAYDQVVDTLSARLYTQKGWAEHPEVLTMPLSPPWVIIGFPRTGTTALHRLLAIDSQFQGLEYWLSRAPMIRPARETWEIMPEYRACVAHIQATYTPEMQKRHPTTAAGLEECIDVLSQSFIMYDKCDTEQSVRDAYQRYVDVLRLIGGHESYKSWLLKAPHHMVNIGALIAVFPDARIIHIHRHPLEAIPSWCSMVHMGRRMLVGAAARTDDIGSLECAYWHKALERTQAARQKLPMQFCDVDHRRFLRDPLGTVRSIYEHFGLALSACTERQMRTWIATNSPAKRDLHRYAIAQYGMTEADICDIFSEYMAQYEFR